MFGKISGKSIRHTFNNLEGHLNNGYNHVKHIAHHIDHGVGIAKQVYKVLEPVIKEYTGNSFGNHAMKALSGYESIRNKAVEANNTVSKVGHKLGGLI